MGATRRQALAGGSRRLGAAAMAGGALWVAACSAGAGSGAGGVGEIAPRPTALRSGVKLSILNALNQAAAPVFEDVLAGWKKEHPGVDVEWIQPQGAVNLTAMTAAGTPPNVFAYTQDEMAAFASNGEVLVVDPYLKRDRIDLADFFPASLQLCRFQGKQYGLARAYNCGPLYTNLNLFDQAGVPRPPEQWGGPKWTWADFVDSARRLSVQSEDPKQARYGADLLGGMGFFFAFVIANGGELFNADMTATRLNEPAATEALQWMADLIHRHRANPTPAVSQALGGRNIFNNGQAAMQFIGASNLNLYYPIDQFTWDWRPLPAGKAGPKSWGGGQVWSVSSKGQLTEESWSLFQHVTSVESQTALAVQYFPPRKRSTQQFLDAEAKAGRPPKNRQMILDVMANAYVRPAHPRYNDVQKVFDEELAPLWSQGGSAQSAGDAIKRRVDPILQSR